MINNWHKEAVVYQIYPRSFSDSNGDGVGDLRGIINQLDYIESLGVNAVWLNPIYKSPNDDGGYDISDYYSIQPEFGTMADFDELLAELHKRNIRLIMDMVLNHSSDEHAWFQESRKSENNPFREFYFWKKGNEGAPPNNWLSFFGGSAWQFDSATSSYYLHLFSRKQPDLNWEHKPLREEIKKLIRFWLEKGVDGLRLDFISAISKRIDFPDSELTDFNQTVKKYYTNGPRLKEYLTELRHEVFDRYNTVTVGEGPGITPTNALDYLSDQDGLSMIFHFGHMFLDQGEGGRFDPKPWTLDQFKKIFTDWDATFSSRGWGSVFLGNHDFGRMVSRWGNDKEYPKESSKLLITLLLTMHGTPFIFQGDEIGMTNFEMKSIGESKDVETINGWKEAQKKGESEESFLLKANYAGRDNARTPMQWDNSSNAGFSSVVPWMPVNPNYQTINIAQQQTDGNSVLNYFRKMMRTRKSSDVLISGSYELVIIDNPNLFIFQRKKGEKKITVALNFSSKEVDCPIQFNLDKILIGNYPTVVKNKLRPWESLVINSD